MEPIEITAVIAAPLGTVWAAYTDPKHITGWNFASEDWHCPKAQNDLRVGGVLSSRMEAKDGSFGFDLISVYRIVEHEALLDMTLEDGRRVRTSFQTEEGLVRVTTRFDPETEHAREMQRSGWQAILNNFKTYAEKL
ncbi:MAG: SRPBCC domain-containing protein [Maritimibacter sp.]